MVRDGMGCSFNFANPWSGVLPASLLPVGASTICMQIPCAEGW